MSYDPKDVDTLVGAVLAWRQGPPSGPLTDQDRALLKAIAPFHTPKPQNVVPKYYGSFYGTSGSELHGILVALEAKIDALAEKVK